MSKGEKKIFVTALKDNNPDQEIVYYIACPSMIDASIAVSRMFDAMLKPTRLHVSGSDDLEKQCCEKYRRDSIEMVEFDEEYDIHSA